MKYESLMRSSNDSISSSHSDSSSPILSLTKNLISSPFHSDSLDDGMTSNDTESEEGACRGKFFIEKNQPILDEVTVNFVDDNSTGNSDDENNELFGLHENSSLMEQLAVLVKQALPVVISFFLGIGGTFINLVFAGNYVHESGDKSAVFAGVSLANMFANVSCLSILIGMSSAVETLGSQHNGAGNYKEVGIVLQRSILILAVITLPIIILWFYTADIFRLLEVEENVCVVINKFIRIRSLTIPIDIVNESYEKYLMSIGVMRPSMWANISFNVFILFFDLLFVYGLKLNYECLAWSWVISMYLSGIVQLGLSWHHPSVARTLQPWNKEALTKWWEFISLGLPGTVMLCSEWWAYEILTIFASLLGTADVAAQTIILQTASLAFMVPLGVGVATSSLVGNALGAQLKTLAIKLGKLVLGSILVLEIIMGVSLFFLGPYFVDLFTNDPKVMEVANDAVPFLSIFTMIDGVQGVGSGVLRGAGKQFIGAVANIIAFYAIGLPMAWFFCFNCNYGVKGLMSGIACGTLFQVIVLVFLIIGCEGYIYSIGTDVHHQVIKFNDDGINSCEAQSDLEAGKEGVAMTSLKNGRSDASGSYSALENIRDDYASTDEGKIGDRDNNANSNSKNNNTSGNSNSNSYSYNKNVDNSGNSCSGSSSSTMGTSSSPGVRNVLHPQSLLSEDIEVEI